MSDQVTVVTPPATIVTIASPAAGPAGPAGASSIAPGTCTPEQFGAVGDGVTNDNAAFVLAYLAMAAGTYGTLRLSAKTYLVTGAGLLPPPGTATIGQGNASILKTTSDNMILKVLLGEDCLFAHFQMQGNNTGIGNQNGIESGYAGNDGANRIVIAHVTARNMGGRGFSMSSQPAPGAVPGPTLIGCKAENCTKQGFGGYQQMQFIGCTARSAIAGSIWLYISAGNVNFTGGDLSANAIGVQVAPGGNGAHGIIADTQINHCTDAAVDMLAFTQGMTFSSCHLYNGQIRMNGNTGMTEFNNCVIDPDTFSFTNAVAKFSNCRMPQGATNTFSVETGSDVEWIDCRGLDGTIPAFVAARMRTVYSFPGDANQTLTKQQSRAAVLDISAGVITAARNLLNARAPKAGETQTVVNRTAQSINFFWSTGNGIVIPTLNTAVIDADATNAVCRLIASNSASAASLTEYLTTLVLTGWYRADWVSSPWAGTAGAGSSGSKSTFSTYGVAPTTGTALNGHVPASFNGTSHGLQDVTNLTPSYISTTAYTVSLLVNFTAAAAPAAAIYDNPGVVVENGGNWGIVFNTNGVSCYHNDGTYKVATRACAISGWHEVDVTYDGTTLTVYVDGVAGAGVAAGTLGTIAGSVLHVGRNYSGAVYQGMLLAETRLAQSAFSPTVLNSIKADDNLRYGLSL